MRSLQSARKTVFAVTLWTAVLTLCVAFPMAEPRMTRDSFERRVILADEIQRCGVSRLGDLVLLFDGWAPVTVDGFAWQSAPRGLDSYQTASWVLMVDGVRVDAGQFGTVTLNRIPVHVSDIDSVEVIPLPQLHHGEFARGGLVHIHTRRGGSGRSVRATVSMGNEAGDPGPFAYTEFATPNVDRIGPDYSLQGSYGVENASGQASYLRYRQYSTDEAVRERTFSIAEGAYPQVTVRAGSGTFAGRLFGGWHRAFLSSSRLEDFFFFKPYGREIPVVSYLTFGGIAGSVPLGGRTVLEYRFGHTVDEIGYRLNTFGIDFDWQTKKSKGGVDITAHTSSLRHRYGLGYERVEAVTGYALSRRDYYLFESFADWEWFSHERLWHRVSVMATHGGDDLSFDAMMAQRWRVNDSNLLEVTASYVEKRPERDGRIWFWDERGYDFLREIGVDATSASPLGTARRWTADAGWASEYRRVASGRVTGYYRDFSDLYLEEQRFQFSSEDRAFSAPVRLLSGQNGGVMGGEAVAEVRFLSRVHFRTVYRYEQAVSGDQSFREVWDAVPRHIFRQSAFCSLVPNLTLWARVNWTSASEWHDYEDAEVQTGGGYRSKLDGFVTVDAALIKWACHGRLKGSLLLRNLGGQAPQYHPIGASFDTSVFVGIEFLVGSVPFGACSRDPG